MWGRETNMIFKKKSSQRGGRVMNRDECGGKGSPQAWEDVELGVIIEKIFISL